MKKLALLAFICLHARLVALPLWFEPNGAHFQARHLLLSPTQAVIHTGESQVMLTLRNANPRARAEGLDRLPGVSNYYLGNDPKKWRTDVPHFARVLYHDVYPGIDLIYHHNAESRLEYDFLVEPGADPKQIKLAYNKPVQIDSGGLLVIAGLKTGHRILGIGDTFASGFATDARARLSLLIRPIHAPLVPSGSVADCWNSPRLRSALFLPAHRIFERNNNASAHVALKPFINGDVFILRVDDL
jgi:hypothetical protein